MGFDRITDANVAPGAEIQRVKLLQQDLVAIDIPLTFWRKALTLEALPTSASGSDLCLQAGVAGVEGSVIKTSNPSGVTVIQLARGLLSLSEWYVDGQTIKLRIHARVRVTPNVSATIDLVAYLRDGELGVGSDICATAAIAVTTTWADKDFVITPTGLAAGDSLDVQVTADVDDTGGGNTALLEIGETKLLLDIRP